jgi:hypothetical protein
MVAIDNDVSNQILQTIAFVLWAWENWEVFTFKELGKKNLQ